MHALEEEKKQAERRSDQGDEGEREARRHTREGVLTIKMKVGEDEKLFGSVTSQMLADALKEQGLTIDKRIIDLEEPIKALGIYTVNVKLHQNVIGKVKVWVVAE